MDLQENESINEALAANQSSSPFIWIRGDVKNLLIIQAFVIFKHVAIPIEDDNRILHALNVCFKLHHVLHVDYAPEVISAWKFIEHGVFLKNFDSKVSHTVKALIGQIMPKIKL